MRKSRKELDSLKIKLKNILRSFVVKSEIKFSVLPNQIKCNHHTILASL